VLLGEPRGFIPGELKTILLQIQQGLFQGVDVLDGVKHRNMWTLEERGDLIRHEEHGLGQTNCKVLLHFGHLRGVARGGRGGGGVLLVRSKLAEGLHNGRILHLKGLKAGVPDSPPGG